MVRLSVFGRGVCGNKKVESMGFHSGLGSVSEAFTDKQTIMFYGNKLLVCCPIRDNYLI